MAEKTEQPTSKKRKDSAKKGNTFKSKDLTVTVVLLVGIFYLAHVLSFSSFVEFYSHLLLNTTRMGIGVFLIALMKNFFWMVLPFIGVCTITGSLTTLLQTKFTIATEALKLNFKALNPVEGFKKIFSMRTVKELVKSLCYLLVFSVTCYSLIQNELRQALTVYHAEIPQLVIVWVTLSVKAVVIFIAWSIFVLLADLIVEYFLYFKDIKMDKHEVKQEYKESEGDPLIKGARRRLHQELLSGEEMAAIRNSEVVMANPTHIALAIYFKPETAPLPFITLRSRNMKAKAAIAYAEKIGVPVVRNIQLTRRLYHTYRQYSFIGYDDEAMLEVIDILIWLHKVELAGIEPEIENIETVDKVETNETNEKVQINPADKPLD